MVFSSLLFIFYFLPIVLVLYFAVKRKYRNFILLLASLVFYSWGEPRYVWIMLFSTVLDYTCGLEIDRAQKNEDGRKAKLFLLLSIVANLSLLIFFKYSNFIILNLNSLMNLNLQVLQITLPIGISFYTFQTMSYSIDVYRQETSAQRNIFNFATYVTLFPQLIAGPIVRYQTVAHEIDSRTESVDMVSDGMQRFVVGLGKKVLLANNIGRVWHNISSGLVEMSVATAWLGIIAFAFQIYFDFSGYSDMAIGLGKIFGFNFLENFNYPYMSKSITEFWRRWHISLGTWFKEYVYIPLGGNRGSSLFQLRNILIVWLLTGIWHGASWNFLFWGLFFAILLIIEKLFLLSWLQKVSPLISHTYTLLLVLISWVIFSFDSFSMGLDYLQMMFGVGSINLLNPDFLYLFQSNFLLIIILIVASTHYPVRFYKNSKIKNTAVRMFVENAFLCTIFILCVSYLVNSTFNPFLYFKF